MARGKLKPTAERLRGHGYKPPDPNIPQPERATPRALATIRERLTCEDARFWWDQTIKAGAANLLVTETTLAAFRDWAEAEADLDHWQREFTKRREAGLPITNREMVVVPAHEVVVDGILKTVEERQISAMGASALLKNAVERAGLLREKNGFTALDITKIRVLRQKDMWEEDMSDQRKTFAEIGYRVIEGGKSANAA
jgi:hypothetical protein